MELELRQAELAGDKLEHGDQVGRETIAVSLAFGGAKDAVQSLHERVGHPPLPVSQDFRQVVFDHLRQLQHRRHEMVLVEASHPAAWAFVIAFPTPDVLVKAGKRKWKKFLHVHKLARPATCQRRLEIFARARQSAGSEATIRAKSAVARAEQLQLLESQIAEYRQEIRRLFAQHQSAGRSFIPAVHARSSTSGGKRFHSFRVHP